MGKHHFPTQEQLDEFRDAAFARGADWQEIGHWVHALQDSYSHQRGKKCRSDWQEPFYVPGSISSLGIPSGRMPWHLRKGHKPDHTWWRPELAFLMAHDVYSELVRLAEQRGYMPLRSWNEIASVVSAFNHERSMKDKLRILFGDMVTW